MKLLHIVSLISAAILSTACATSPGAASGPLTISEQGSFAVGGKVIQSQGTFNPNLPFEAAGQTLHGDHARVFYQKPITPRKYPMTFLHGAGQFSKTWESTPDGREGFQTLFLRRNFSVYVLDQPRRGGAGRSTVAASVAPTTDDQMWFQQFRLGVWPSFNPGVQVPQDKASMDQFFRQMTPNTGPYDAGVISDSVAALYARTGPGILVTHSQGGGPGWLSAMKSRDIKAIVSYEAGSGFPFPEGEVPDPIPNRFNKLLTADRVPLDEFKKLTRMPIIVYYGDFIPDAPHENPAKDYWHAAVRMANLWAATVNKHGGDVTILQLPKAGIPGNTHFAFSDLNNVQVADHLSAWLREKKLD